LTILYKSHLLVAAHSLNTSAIETLINEEALLFAKYLRNERQT